MVLNTNISRQHNKLKNQTREINCRPETEGNHFKQAVFSFIPSTKKLHDDPQLSQLSFTSCLCCHQ